MRNAFFPGVGATSCDRTQESDDQQDIANRFRQHQHAEHRNKPGADRHRDIEQEGQQDIQPQRLKEPIFFPLLKIEPANGCAKQNKWDIPYDAPRRIAVVCEPAVLREKTQNDADC